MRPIRWIKELLYIVRNYDRNFGGLLSHQELQNKRILSLRSAIDDLDEVLRERTQLAVDVPAMRNYPATVVLVGRYNENDFVQVYQIFPEDFGALVDHVKQLSRYAKLTNVDAPFQLREYIRKEI